MNRQPPLTRHLREQQLKRWHSDRIDKTSLEKNKKNERISRLPDIKIYKVIVIDSVWFGTKTDEWHRIKFPATDPQRYSHLLYI